MYKKDKCFMYYLNRKKKGSQQYHYLHWTSKINNDNKNKV